MKITSERAAAISAIALGLLLSVSPNASAQSVPKVVGLELGYGYATSSREPNYQSPSVLIAGLRYGYLILDKPSTSAVLSLALGYNWLPEGSGGQSLGAFVYGLEYEHILFRQSPVALSVEYGLLFDMIFEGGRAGYAFGNHTRLGLGPDFKLGEKDDLLLLADYNILDMPYFDYSTAKLSYASLALRYQRRL
jgi:hypothetical protein